MALSRLHHFLKKPRPRSLSGSKPFGRNRFVPNLEALAGTVSYTSPGVVSHLDDILRRPLMGSPHETEKIVR